MRPLKCLSAAGAARQTSKFNKLLADCLAHGAVYGPGPAKLHTGALPPGCRLCADGTCSSLFLTEDCSRSCSFCPLDRAAGGGAPAHEMMNGFVFSSPEKYARYLADFGYRGAGFSGGEPLLEFNRLLAYVKALRAVPGRRLRLWAYTNGDLADAAKLKALAAAGLDELRFDLAARDYDLAPLRLALKYLRSVGVEMPVIPEDKDAVLALLPQLQALGVDFVNLHQLRYTRHNHAAFAKRAYTLVRTGGSEPSVLESELAALEIMRAAQAACPALPVHYCGGLFKERCVARAGTRREAWRLRRAQGFRPETGALTGAGLMRRLYWRGGAAEMKAACRRRNRARPGSCSVKDGKLFLHPALLRGAGLDGRIVTAAYSRFLQRRGGGRGAPEQETVSEVELATPAARRLFSDIFVGGKSPEAAARRLAGAAGAKKLERAAAAFRLKFEGLEFLPEGFTAY